MNRAERTSGSVKTRYFLRRTRLALVGAAAACFMLAPSVAAADKTPPIIAVDTVDTARLAGLPAFIDKTVAKLIVSNEVAGAVVTVVYNGEVFSNAGYGFQDIERDIAVDPDNTLFRPGSVSKLFTWIALMQQIEQGKVDLDADINDYIDFEVPRNGFDPIRVRDLFSHTLGTSDVGGLFASSVDRLVPFQTWVKARVPWRVWAPGIETAYSNWGSVVAGYIVERVSGEPFADYVENHIFKPLNMNAASFREPIEGARLRNLAVGYRVVNGKMVAEEQEYISPVMPAGSSSVNGADMANFMLAILNGGQLGGNRILKPESMTLLGSDLFSNAPRLPGMAHGFFVKRESNPRLIGHGGNTGDFHSVLVVAPNLGFGFFISMTGGRGSSPARTDLENAILGYVFPQKPTARWSGPAETAPMGSYRGNRRDYGAAPNPQFDTIVKALGRNTLEITVEGETAKWERIGPHLYEKATDVDKGGPYDRAEFYATSRGQCLSFASLPYETFHYVEPK